MEMNGSSHWEGLVCPKSYHYSPRRGAFGVHSVLASRRGGANGAGVRQTIGPWAGRVGMSEIWIDRRVLLHWTSTGGVASWVRWYGGGIVSMSIAGRGGGRWNSTVASGKGSRSKRSEASTPALLNIEHRLGSKVTRATLSRPFLPQTPTTNANTHTHTPTPPH